MGLCLFMLRGSMMACGSESLIFRSWTRTIAACLNSAMVLGCILKMAMLTPSIPEWQQTIVAGGTSMMERSTGITQEWRRMKTAGGTIATAGSTGIIQEREPVNMVRGIIRMDVFRMA